MNKMNSSFADDRAPETEAADAAEDRAESADARGPDGKPGTAPDRAPAKSPAAPSDAPSDARPAAAGSQPGAEADTPPARKGRGRKLVLGGIGIVLVVGAAVYGYNYWTVGRFMVSTDDAYVDADSVMVSPRVGGQIEQIAVRNNQSVTKGQILARIDDSDLKNALASAQAKLAAARADASALVAQIAQQKTSVTEAQATVSVDRAQLDYAKLENRRYDQLSQKGAGSIQNAQQARTDLAAKQATLDHDTAAVEAAKQQVAILQSQLAAEKAQVTQLASDADQARLNLGYATIRAPFDGTVGNLTGRVGQNVTSSTPILVLVPMSRTYVTANYKETQLGDVHPGQSVKISVDTFPGQSVRGTVESISPASGQKFSLLPADNATGNFTKVVQRIPVRIEIDQNDPLAGKLRPGMSVEPVIDTRTGGNADTAGGKG
ncbi:HlyD family secretion protein [Acidimangrovimonas sediminis]|uniref:HlyD family secretion protein n=1 Tax=Acidimangrovimonas sediminis TaxID=2056283 RepID=UPI0018EABC93|nr:HlyD family secretion protein [Acidimangrovimonas sediminis]